MENINYIHINAKEFSWMYGHMLNSYESLKQAKYVNFENFFKSSFSSATNDSYIEAAFKNNQLIGFISYSLNEHYKIFHEKKCQINLIAVLPMYRKQNIGSTLLKNALIHMLNCGINDCTLFCSNEFDSIGYNFWMSKNVQILNSFYERNMKIELLSIPNIEELLNNYCHNKC